MLYQFYAKVKMEKNLTCIPSTTGLLLFLYLNTCFEVQRTGTSLNQTTQTTAHRNGLKSDRHTAEDLNRFRLSYGNCEPKGFVYCPIRSTKKDKYQPLARLFLYQSPAFAASTPSYPSTAWSRTLAPAATISGSAYSSSLWPMPSRQGMKIMAAGATRAA